MHCEDEEVLQWETFCSCVNKELQKQIKKIIGQDAATPYDISKFDLEEKYPVSILVEDYCASYKNSYRDGNVFLLWR